MRRILTESGVAKIRRPGFGIVSNWEMLLAKLIKVWVVEERTPGIFCAKKKKKKEKKRKKSTRKLLRKVLL